MKRFAYLFVILAALTWSASGIWTRNLMAAGFTSGDLLIWRVLFAALTLFIFTFFRSRESLKIKLRDIWYFIGTGIVSYLFQNYCSFVAMNNLPLAAASTLLYTAPIIVTILSIFIFKERLTISKILAVGLSFLGSALVTGFLGGGQVELSTSGLIYGIFSGLGYALYSIFSRLALQKYSSLTVTAYTFLFAAIGALPVFDVRNALPILSERPSFLFILLLFTLATSVIPYSLYTLSLNYIEASKASIIAAIEPALCMFWGAFFFDEGFTVPGVIGIFCVIGALMILNLNISLRAKMNKTI